MKLEKTIVEQLNEHHYTVSTAESLTGGMLASAIVDVPGASGCFKEGYVTYCDDAKHRILGVREITLLEYSAVSKQCAKEMALGVKKRSNSDFGIVTTGYAGPDGGTKENPVGTFYISCSYLDKVKTCRFCVKGSRYQVRAYAMEYALRLLYDCIMEVIKQEQI